MSITRKFPEIYVLRLDKMLHPLESSSFVFVNRSTGHPLTDTHFKEAFKRYCGKEFFPHIVRSYYATAKAKEFLKNHKKARKKEIRQFFLSLAERLGHKRFVKDKGVWKESYTVTVNHYIQPEIVEKIKALADK